MFTLRERGEIFFIIIIILIKFFVYFLRGVAAFLGQQKPFPALTQIAVRGVEFMCPKEYSGGGDGG